MKIEPRGKYPGVKVHLDEKECEAVLTDAKKTDKKAFLEFGLKLASKIFKLQQEKPNLLDARTDEEIRAELEEERDKAIKKLAAMDEGKDWKGIKA